jgi:hypothetical protein
VLEKNLVEGRRQFLAKALPAGAIFCLGCKGLMASPALLGNQEIAGKKPKYLEDAGMTAEGVYQFAYGYFLPFLENIGNSLGREKLLDLIKKAGADIYTQLTPILAKDIPSRDPKSLAKLIGDFMTGTSIYRQAFTFEITELTDKVYEATYSQCLPAKMFREMNAADFGYAFECSPAHTLAKVFNPKMTLLNPKNLMKGDSVCIERYVLEE